MSSPSIFREPAVRRVRQERFLRDKRLATANHSCVFRTSFCFLHANAPMRRIPNRDAIGVGSSLEGRIKTTSTSDHAFESGHATPLEAQTHFGRNARQRRNSDVTNLVIVGRSAAGSRLRLHSLSEWGRHAAGHEMQNSRIFSGVSRLKKKGREGASHIMSLRLIRG